jgi:hypothetical protein
MSLAEQIGHNKSASDAREEIKAKMRDLVDSTNKLNRESDVAYAILQGLYSSHPTLQQSFIRGLHAALKEYGEMVGDDRNAASRAWAAEATEEEKIFPFI